MKMISLPRQLISCHIFRTVIRSLQVKADDFLVEKTRKLALFIDGTNIDNAKYISQVLDEVSKYGDVAVKRLHADMSNPAAEIWKNICIKHSIDTVHTFRYADKTNSDIALTMDAMKVLHENAVSGFVIFADALYHTPLVSRIRRERLFVIGVGYSGEKSLPECYDTFYWIDKHREPAAGEDIWGWTTREYRLLDAAYDAVRNPTTGRADISLLKTRLGSVGSRIQGKFSDFCKGLPGYEFISVTSKSFIRRIAVSGDTAEKSISLSVGSTTTPQAHPDSADGLEIVPAGRADDTFCFDATHAVAVPMPEASDLQTQYRELPIHVKTMLS